MKTHFILSAALLVLASIFSSCKKDRDKTPPPIIIVESTAPWETDLGTASFATDSIWKIVSADNTIVQEWSDAVQTVDCSNKTTFNGGEIEYGENWIILSYHFNIDCRSNPNYKGDLFSWRAVAEVENICPEGWRVPILRDFIDLNVALGGNGGNGGHGKWVGEFIKKNYISRWGGEVNSVTCYPNGELWGWAEYWSQSQTSESIVIGSVRRGYALEFSGLAHFNPMGQTHKHYGLKLRCVR